MARLKMAPYLYSEGPGERQLSPLQRGHQGPQVLSKLEVLKNEYQERALREKEQKMLKLLTQQQERISQRINGGRAQRPPGDKTWASNWTVAKRTAGVDRAHPLQPVCPRSVHRSPSANMATAPHPLPYVRSKSGPSRTEQWQALEKSEMDLEAEIRRKEALLREKLRRTEEELRRIQREKEEAEREERRAREIQDTRTRPRRTRPEEGDGGGSKKTNPHSIDPHSGGNTRTNPHSIDPHSGGNTRTNPHSIDHHSGGHMKTRKDSPHSIGESHEQYVGVRDTSPLVLQDASLTRVVDTFNELRLGALGVRDRGRPLSGHTDGGAVPDDDPPQSPGQPLVPCPLCGRRFMEHRLEKHSAVCEKMHSSRRKVFDSSKARAKGTDLEQYLHKKGRPPSPAPQVRATSWRQKHESFLRTIRQARVVQDVVARGGKISDLPPPPPEENPDYVACPHCSRRFAPRAAERHIPKCETIKSKPRPPPSHRR